MVVVSTNRSIFQGSNLHTLLALTLILKATIPFNGTGSGSALPNQTDLNRTHLYASKINNQTRAYHRTLYTKNRVEMPMD